MTRAQFLQELGQYLKYPQCKAFITSDLIRLDCADFGYMCPITFVHYGRTGAYIQNCDAVWAGLNMGLSAETVDAIIEAADNYAEFAWESPLQKRIVKVLGLGTP